MNGIQINRFYTCIGSMKGEIISGAQFEKTMNWLFATLGSNEKWHIEDHIDDCSYEDDMGKVNEFYVHVEFENEYADMQCIINNYDEGKNNWGVLVKDVIVKEGGIG